MARFGRITFRPPEKHPFLLHGQPPVQSTPAVDQVCSTLHHSQFLIRVPTVLPHAPPAVGLVSSSPFSSPVASAKRLFLSLGLGLSPISKQLSCTTLETGVAMFIVCLALWTVHWSSSWARGKTVSCGGGFMQLSFRSYARSLMTVVAVWTGIEILLVRLGCVNAVGGICPSTLLWKRK